MIPFIFLFLGDKRLFFFLTFNQPSKTQDITKQPKNIILFNFLFRKKKHINLQDTNFLSPTEQKAISKIPDMKNLKHPKTVSNHNAKPLTKNPPFFSNVFEKDKYFKKCKTYG
jgi:hypothetical protein